MSTIPTPQFGAQLIGQTEKALNAFLDRLLAGPGLSEAQWIALTLAVRAGGRSDSAELAGALAHALKVGEGQARSLLAELADSGLLDLGAGEHGPVAPTPAGEELHRGIRASVAEVTERMWGDIPAADLAVAGRVLGTVLERANAQLAA